MFDTTIQRIKDYFNIKTNFDRQLKDVQKLITKYQYYLDKECYMSNYEKREYFKQNELHVSLTFSIMNQLSGNNYNKHNSDNIGCRDTVFTFFVFEDIEKNIPYIFNYLFSKFDYDISIDESEHHIAYCKKSIEILEKFKCWLLERAIIKPPSVIFNK